MIPRSTLLAITRLFFAALLLASVPASAKTYAFEKYQCQCDVPDGWAIKSVEGVELLNAHRLTDGASFTLYVSPTPKWASLHASPFRDYVENKLRRQYGYITYFKTFLTVHGQEFSYRKERWSLNRKHYINTLAIEANGYEYSSVVFLVKGDPETDPELDAVEKSFQFTQPPEIHRPSSLTTWGKATDVFRLFHDDHRPYYWILCSLFLIKIIFQAVALPVLLSYAAVLAALFWIIRKKRTSAKGTT